MKVLPLLLPTQNQRAHTHTHTDTTLWLVSSSPNLHVVSQAKPFLVLLIPALPLSLSVLPAALRDQTRMPAGVKAQVPVHQHPSLPCCRRKGVRETPPPVLP